MALRVDFFHSLGFCKESLQLPGSLASVLWSALGEWGWGLGESMTGHLYFPGRRVTTVLGRHLFVVLAKYIPSNYSFS